ncbi:NFACT RNA binding domain-containing protein [Candidatus Woesearchaeota archaeon]|nr:NFACT RNA binding domain-containing protein [Candidatus Woesearchaeota archaeon]
MEVDFFVEKSLDENASIYFDLAKKAKKKLEGTKRALLNEKKKLDALLSEQSEVLKTDLKIKSEKDRKKNWYENFRWFFSSDGFLVIGGKDSSSNELIIKKHVDKNDLVFHTEAPGSPFVVIKNPNALAVPDLTKMEAAELAVTFSKAWAMKIRSVEVFMVLPNQVSKEANSGEYVAKGAFVIRGKKVLFDPVVNFAIGIFLDEDGNKIVMSGPRSAVKKKCNVFVEIKQGDSKKGEVSKILMKKFGLSTNDDIIANLPSGGLKL